MAEFSLTSSAFVDGQAIPPRHTCDGEDRSPPLSWSAPPAGTRSLALILGPCPPRGHGRHRYRFRLHAVAEDLRLAPGAGVRDLELALTAMVLAVAELVGTHGR